MMACAHPFRDLAKPSLSDDRPWSCQTKQKNFFVGAQKKFLLFVTAPNARGARALALVQSGIGVTHDRLLGGAVSRGIPFFRIAGITASRAHPESCVPSFLPQLQIFRTEGNRARGQ